MNKRGISAVVATILIILIVVVGVGIVWKVILPIFAELQYLSYSDVQLNIVRQGFTVYDEEQHFAFVQIERGGDDINMTGIEIGFNFGGTTKTYQSMNVPTPNGKYTYKFNFTNDSDMGIPQGIAPDKVTVAPIFTINNKERLGKILDSEDMPVGRIRLSALEWEKANKEAATPIVVTTGSGDGEEPGEPVEPVVPPITCENGEIEYRGKCVIPVDSCQTLALAGEYYLLNKSLSTTDDCFRIDEDNIIIDLGGYKLDGLGGKWNSGVITSKENITIKNGEINGFGSGINLHSSLGHILIDLIVTQNLGGISISSSSSNVLTNIIANLNADFGISMGTSSGNILTNITTNSNHEGIHLLAVSNSSFENITANLNYVGIKLTAFSFTGKSENNSFYNVDAINNSRGIYLISSLNNSFDKVNVSLNSIAGVYLVDSLSTEISNSFICGNKFEQVGDYDLMFMDATGCFGDGNIIGNVLGPCSGWPTNPEHYTSCA